MHFAIRWFQRLVIFAIATATLWFIVTQLFDRLEQRLPVFAALLVTYVLSAYVLLPVVVRASVAVLRRNRIPRTTRAGDGLPADPVNVVLFGSQEELHAAFAATGWATAEPLTPRSAWKMATSFVLDRSYPTAPFSALYLFGRRQDIGFQQQVGNSPRRRHHVRFWAADADPEADLTDLAYWTSRQRVDLADCRIWVGAGTTDIGFGFQALTYQISHRVDAHADAERDHVADTLRVAGRIRDESYIEGGVLEGTRFVSDGRMWRGVLR